MNRVRMPKPRNKDVFKGKHYMPSPKAKLKLGIRSSIMLIFVFALLYIIIQNTNNIFAYFQSQDSITNEFDIQRRTITYEYYVYDENNNSSVLQASTTREILPTEVITLTPGGSLSNDHTYILKFDIENTEYNANDTYTMPNRDITIKENYYKREFKVHFDANGGTGTMSDQDFVYGTPRNLTANAFTNAGLIFAGWNTEPDGSGTHYANRAEFTITDINTTTINLYAEWASGIARIDTTYYQTLEEAMESVTSGQTKTVYLLADTNEYLIETKSGANITLDLQGNTLRNYSNNDNKAIIESNKATLRITNGNIITNAAQGAINNPSGGTLNLDNVNITVSGKRQAIYNNGGTANISSTVNIITNAANRERPLLHNLSGGTMNINGATITDNATFANTNDSKAKYRMATIANIGNSTITITDATINSLNGESIRNAESTTSGIVTISGDTSITSSSSNYSAVNIEKGTVNVLGGSIIASNTSTPQTAVYSKGTVNIGTQGGNVSVTDPVIQGTNYGLYINSGSAYFYDGIIRGLTNPAINNETAISTIESGYELIHDTVNIDGNNFNQVTLGSLVNEYTVTFDANGGTVSPTFKTCSIGDPIGSMPTPVWEHHNFLGWYTDPIAGTLVQETDSFASNTPVYAHWEELQGVIANGVHYPTITDALNAIPAHTLTTITLIDDINECIEIAADKEIILDLDGHTITNVGLSKPIITNKGTVTTLTGNLETDSNTTGAIDNIEGGHLVIDGVTIHSHGNRQALYNNNSYMEIKGNSYLTSNATGYVLDNASNLERATVNNVNSGTLVITGGVIECATHPAVCSNSGTLTIGVSGGSLSTTSPSIQGNTDGIHCTGALEFYDGAIKGKTNAINATITNQESGTQVVNGTESIGGETYITAHLEVMP